MKLIKKTISEYDKLIKKELYETFSEVRETVKELIMQEYNSNLVIMDRKSKTNPLLPRYKDEFMNRLHEFEYIKEIGSDLVFVTPDMENFDFSGARMRVIENILSGTVGIYVEVSADDYEKMFGKSIISREPLDTDVSRKEIVFLMKYNNTVRTAERRTFGRPGYLVRYPFSNTPPIDIFDEAERYVNANIDKWAVNAVKVASKNFIWKGFDRPEIYYPAD